MTIFQQLVGKRVLVCHENNHGKIVDHHYSLVGIDETFRCLHLRGEGIMRGETIIPIDRVIHVEVEEDVE